MGEAALTEHQLEIVRLVSEALSDKEIAQRLFVEVPTVKNTLHRIYSKTSTHSRVELIRKFFDLVAKSA